MIPFEVKKKKGWVFFLYIVCSLFLYFFVFSNGLAKCETYYQQKTLILV